MKVRWLGVALHVAKGLSVGDVFSQLATKHAIEFPYSGHERIAYVSKIASWHVALFLQISDHRKYMRITTAGGKVKVEPEEVAKGSQIVDFNFLGVHEGTGRGLYQHYRGSLGVATLTNILNREHNAAVTTKRRAFLTANGETAANAKITRHMHDGKFVLAQIVTKEDLPALLARLDEVRRMTLDIVELSHVGDSFRPLEAHVAVSRYQARFKPDLSGQSLATKIIALIKKEKPIGGRIEGMEGNERRTFDIYDDPPHIFGEHDFDTVAAAFEPENFAKTSHLKSMIKEMQNNPSLFEKPEKP